MYSQILYVVFNKSQFWRGILVLGIFLFGWKILHEKAKNVLINAIAEFKSPILMLSSNISNFIDYFSVSKKDLIRKNRDLMKQNVYCKMKLQDLEARFSDLKNVSQVFEIFDFEKELYRCEFAQVVFRDIGTWNQQLVINKGRLDGMTENLAVISNFGVIGKIKKTYLWTSVVELVTSVGFRLIGCFENDKRSVLYTGLGGKWLNGGKMGKVTDVSKDIKIENGLQKRLVTSGLGGVFPKGVHIGMVEQLQDDSSGLFKIGSVVLPECIGSVKEIIVLIPISRGLI